MILGSIAIEPFAKQYGLVAFLFGLLFVVVVTAFVVMDFRAPVFEIIWALILSAFIVIELGNVDTEYAAAMDARVAAVEKELGGPLIDGDVVEGGILVIGSTDGSLNIVNSVVLEDTMLFFDASSSSPEVVN